MPFSAVVDSRFLGNWLGSPALVGGRDTPHNKPSLRNSPPGRRPGLRPGRHRQVGHPPNCRRHPNGRRHQINWLGHGLCPCLCPCLGLGLPCLGKMGPLYHPWRCLCRRRPCRDWWRSHGQCAQICHNHNIGCWGCPSLFLLFLFPWRLSRLFAASLPPPPIWSIHIPAA